MYSAFRSEDTEALLHFTSHLYLLLFVATTSASDSVSYCRLCVRYKSYSFILLYANVSHLESREIHLVRGCRVFQQHLSRQPRQVRLAYQDYRENPMLQ